MRFGGGLTRRALGALTYEAALRAVGQDLAGLAIESLEIKVEGNIFVAHGIRIGSADDSRSKSTIRLLRRLRRGIAAMTGQGGKPIQRSRRERFARRYTVGQIQVLDKLGFARQTGLVKTPDPSSLAESLRTVGRVVDAKKGRLVSLYKDQRAIKFAYKNENGWLDKQEFYSLSIYKTQQEALALRKEKGNI
ncbi:MAG TPA: hypothetical protein VGL11_20800 [Candidatus Binatia bacterium]|jgi:hypothetical protein